MRSSVDRLDWPALEAALNQDGFALLPGLLAGADLRGLLDAPQPPAWVGELQAACHAHLVPIARHWNEAFGVAQKGPGSPLPPSSGSIRITRLASGEHQPLQQGDSDPHGFPLQLVALLNAPGVDFSGGEFVMTERRPRMQSRPLVVPLRQGDAAVIAVGQRPVNGSQGPYRVHLKHGVSRVRSGMRLGLQIGFDPL